MTKIGKNYSFLEKDLKKENEELKAEIKKLKSKKNKTEETKE